MVTKRDVLEELNLTKLKTIAKRLGIEIPKSVGGFLAKAGLGVELRRPYIEALANSRIVTMEEIDRILGTDFSGTGVGRQAAAERATRRAQEKVPETVAEPESAEEPEESGTVTLDLILKRYFYKDQLQDLCDKLELAVTGNKDILIERIVADENFSPDLMTHLMDKDQLKTLCDEMGLKTSGTRDDLERRVLDALAAGDISTFLAEPSVRQPPPQAAPPRIPAEDRVQPTRTPQRRELFAPQDTSTLSPLEFPETPSPSLIPEAQAPQIAQLQMVSEFLENYRPSRRFRNEQAYEIEIAAEMRQQFGAENVKTQVSIYGGRIDVEVLGIGVEIKVPASRGQLQTLLGQISIYRQQYGPNLMVVIFSDLAKMQDITEFANVLRGRGVTVFVK